MITNTDPQLCTSAPMTGFKIPVIASTIAAKFSSIYCDVTANATHGDADHRFFERRCVVYTVSDHTYRLPLMLVAVDQVQLILRQTVRMYLRMPSSPAIWFAAASWSPVSSTGSMPSPMKSLTIL